MDRWPDAIEELPPPPLNRNQELLPPRDSKAAASLSVFGHPLRKRRRRRMWL
jgi:hypothetical protein